MDIIIMTYIFVVGLIFGSFYNVVILRPFSNESIVLPPSKCPKCNHKLAWYDNIPLFSYMLLRAKCRYCHESIHWQYPLVEFITGALFLCSYLKFGFTWQCLFMIIALSYFIIMSATDFKEQIVFDMHAIPFIIIGVVYGIITGNYLDTALGVLAGALIMELVARSGYLFVGKRAFGEGDTYIAAGIGAFLGLKGIIVTIVFSVLLQALWAIPMLLKKYIDNKKYSELISFFILALIIIGYWFINKNNGFDSLYFFIAYVILMVACALIVCKSIISSVSLDGGGTYLPFGPALFLGAAIVIFFGTQIFDFLRQIEWLANVL